MKTMSIDDRAAHFRSLHTPGTPLILHNIWDAGSAATVARKGAAAIATGSWSIAAANGYADGEKIPRDLLIATLRRIVAATDLPVTVDLESGYGNGDALADTIRLSIEAGAVGCNLEDSHPADGSLRDIEDAAARLAMARRAADALLPGFFINARTDVYLQPSEGDGEAALGETLARGRAYAEAGADGLFVPGLAELPMIEKLAQAAPLPLNIMRQSETPRIKDLANVGVARVSHGPRPYLIAMDALEKIALER
jgi:2-methylisocitrate lyase-like PEP mutase family enzyme